MSSTTLNSLAAQEVDQAKRLHLDFLDGIRALAALYVVACHYQSSLHAVSGIEKFATLWLKAGHQAVDVFIVLSGFCLIIPVARTGHLKGGAGRFYARRYRRILPPYYASIILSFLIPALALQTGHPFAHLTPKIMLTNLLLLQDVCANNTVNPVLWSVALECKIYLFFPLLVWILRKKGPVPTLAASALLGYGLAFAFSSRGVSLGEAYPWYLFLFTAGMTSGWLAFKPAPVGEAPGFVPRSGQLRKDALALMLTGMGAILMVALLLRLHFVMPGAYRHMPLIDGGLGIVTAALLLVLTLRHQAVLWLSRLLNLRPLVYIGAFAYSIYLIHVPLQTVQFHLFGNGPFHSVAVNHLLMLIMGMPLIVGFAYLFFLAFERPFLNTRRRETLLETAHAAAISPAP